MILIEVRLLCLLRAHTMIQVMCHFWNLQGFSILTGIVQWLKESKYKFVFIFHSAYIKKALNAVPIILEGTRQLTTPQ